MSVLNHLDRTTTIELMDNVPVSVCHVAADAAVVAAADPGRVSDSSGSENMISHFARLFLFTLELSNCVESGREI